MSDDGSVLAKAIREAYEKGQEDEALEPIIKVDYAGGPVGRLRKGDSVIFYDIRGEREIQITKSLVADDFRHFPRTEGLALNFVTMIEYDPRLKAKIAFPSEKVLKNTLVEVVSKAGLRLVKISESEKAIHVGFFMNGKRDKLFPGEERVVVPSAQNVSSYAHLPEMCAAKVADEVVSALADSSCQVIIANLANVDVVGHTVEKAAVIKAVETVDSQLGRIVGVVQAHGVTLVITSDHGTVEEWYYPNGTINTGHTKSDVPFILADFSSPGGKFQALREKGELADVAPTVLDLLGLEKPPEMTGKSLLTRSPAAEKRRKILLLIMDGWGHSAEVKGNLIREASTPHFDRLWAEYPHSLLKASGEAVGMPADTVGNSEAGHLHLGAGRQVMLDRVRIDTAIQDGSFDSNPAFLWAMERAKREQKALHLLGIVSFYSSHGTIDHLFALLRLARRMGMQDVYVHSLIGRRGEKPESGAAYVERVEKVCEELGVGEVVTVMGRYWALDREENWDRVEKAYRALVYGEGTRAP